MLIYRNGESREVSITEEQFNASALPEKGWALTDTFVPVAVTMRQARLQLLQMGLLNAVQSAVTAQGTAAQITWDVSSEVLRTNPLIAQMQALLHWTDAQVDQMFREAAKL